MFSNETWRARTASTVKRSTVLLLRMQEDSQLPVNHETLLSPVERDAVFKKLLGSLLESRNENEPGLTLNEKASLMLLSWFNRPGGVSVADAEEGTSPAPRPSGVAGMPLAVFDNYMRIPPSSKLWYLVEGIGSRRLKKYRLEEELGVSMYVYITRSDGLAILNIQSLLCTLCGHFQELELSCVHLLHLYFYLSHQVGTIQSTDGDRDTPAIESLLIDTLIVSKSEYLKTLRRSA